MCSGVAASSGSVGGGNGGGDGGGMGRAEGGAGGTWIASFVAVTERPSLTCMSPRFDSQ